MPKSIERERTYEEAAEMDSFITSRKIAGHGHLALARHHQRFDRQQLTADLGPCQAGHHAHRCSLSASP